MSSSSDIEMIGHHRLKENIDINDDDMDNFQREIQSNEHILPSQALTEESHSLTSWWERAKRSQTIMQCFVITIFITIGIVVMISIILMYRNEGSSSSSTAANHSPDTMESGPDYIDLISSRPKIGICQSYNPSPLYDPPERGSFILKQVRLWRATGNKENLSREETLMDVVVIGGKIFKIYESGRGNKVEIPIGLLEYNAQGKWVTPGLVDLHSHIGVYSIPEDLWGHEDGNEMTQPTTPYVRAMDAFDPEDPAIALVKSSGVTTVNVLPGSGNVIGGEGGAFKLRNKKYVEELRFHEAPPVMKWACGENPKRIYGRNKKIMPMSRMGSVWLLRQQLLMAQELVRKEDQWLANGQKGPTPLLNQYSSLALLLRQCIALHVHCYEVQDMEAIIRLSHEFGFKIASFQHALEAYKLAPILSRAKITIGSFSDLWGYKYEAYDASTQQPYILESSGVNVAIKSDHPVIFSSDLMHEASKAHYYGLSEEGALRSVTIVPAMAMGIGDMLGTLEEGKHADLVVWNSLPIIDIGAIPSLVFIDGKLVSENSQESVVLREDVTAENINGCTPNLSNADIPLQRHSALVIKGIYAVYGYRDSNVGNGNSIIDAACKLVVRILNGVILCVGLEEACTEGGQSLIWSEVRSPCGSIMAGMIDASGKYGRNDIGSEDNTGDGVLSDIGIDIMRVKGDDGLALSSRHATAARRAGITTALTMPKVNGGIYGGDARVVWTYAPSNINNFSSNDFSSFAGGVVFRIGNDAKGGGLSTSVSGQLASLRNYLKISNDTVTSTGKDVMTGKLPMIVFVHKSEYIASLIKIKKAWKNLKLILIGCAEAHLLGKELANENIRVILSPSRAIVGRIWEYNKANPKSLSILLNAGVKVGIAIDDVDNIRNLCWEAGLSVTWGNVSMESAIATATSNISDIFNLGDGVGYVQKNGIANLIIFSGNPLSFRAKVEAVIIGSAVDCEPKQF